MMDLEKANRLQAKLIRKLRATNAALRDEISILRRTAEIVDQAVSINWYSEMPDTYNEDLAEDIAGALMDYNYERSLD